MKNLYILLAVLMMASCKKDESTLQPQLITYEVDCDVCWIYVEDANVNHTNSYLQKYKSFWSNGKFTYTFENTTNVDWITAHVFLSTFYTGKQTITVKISESRYGRSTEVQHEIDFTKGHYEYDINAYLELLER